MVLWIGMTRPFCLLGNLIKTLIKNPAYMGWTCYDQVEEKGVTEYELDFYVIIEQMPVIYM